jgi:cobalt-zinc-cadmium efflux system outer membrane protein
MRLPQTLLALLLSGIATISSPAIAADTEVTAGEWSDPVLSRFVQSVVETNPRVRAARASIDGSQALRNAAAQPLYNPEINLDAENADIETRTIGISQTIDWAGKRVARTTVAESDQLAAEADYKIARWEVIVELLNGLAQYQTGMQKNNLAITRHTLMQDFYRLAQRRFDAGDIAQTELELAHLASTEANIQTATAGTSLAEARQAVFGLTSPSNSESWPSLPDIFPRLPENYMDPMALVEELPRVIAARQRVASADALVELRRVERRPDPTLSLRGGEADGEALIGLNLTVPLFVRNRFNHQVSAAMAERNRVEEVADDIFRRSYARVVSAAERYTLSRDAWGVWQQSGSASLVRQAEQLERLWQAGEISTTDYLVQLSATLNIQESALELKESLWRAWFEWLLASGKVDALLDLDN